LLSDSNRTVQWQDHAKYYLWSYLIDSNFV
jgi:hypothetical protein